MSFGIQCCVKCGNLEEGHTGPANRYVCTSCYREGWRVGSAGTLLPPDVAAELERLRVFRGSELGRALEGRE